MKKNLNRILWGLGLIAAAVLITVDQLHLLTFQLGVMTIIWTIIFGACLIKGLVDRNIYLSVFALAFLVIVYSGPLHIQHLLSVWMILLIALLVAMGLSLLFTKSLKPKITIEKNFRISGDDSRNDSADNIVINQKIGDASRYVHSQHLKSINITTSIGDISVYLDDAQAAGNTVNVNLNSTMGDITLFVPLSWQIDNQLNTSFGNVTIKGQSTGRGPTLVLRGRSNLGDVTINYI